jgi:hypothetical protein
MRENACARMACEGEFEFARIQMHSAIIVWHSRQKAKQDVSEGDSESKMLRYSEQRRMPANLI